MAAATSSGRPPADRVQPAHLFVDARCLHRLLPGEEGARFCWHALCNPPVAPMYSKDIE
jgi:hypothetical protein